MTARRAPAVGRWLIGAASLLGIGGADAPSAFAQFGPTPPPGERQLPRPASEFYFSDGTMDWRTFGDYFAE